MIALRDLTLGQYLPGSSAVHRLDPRAKLAVCCTAMAGVFLPSAALGAALAWPLLVAGVAASRVPVGYYLRGLRPFGWLFAFTVVLHGLTAPGRALWSVPGVPVAFTAEGLLQGAGVSAQLATAIAYSSLLTLTTSPTDLVWALERLLAPLERLGLPVGEFCLTALLAIRFFPILHQEAERLLFALQARGIDPGEGGLRDRVRNLSPLLVPLFRQVFQRAETLALAMEMRGYRPGVRRTSWRARGLGRPEAAALGLALLTLTAGAWARFGAFGAAP
ncbi:MAG: energy-coupling factor transporter transmembrane component T family protein [Deferrisomatales bacterium]